MEINKYFRTTANALIKTGQGVLVGMYVNSTTSGTIKLYDSTSASGTVINNTITLTTGYHDLGSVAFNTGLYAQKTNTVDITFYYR